MSYYCSPKEMAFTSRFQSPGKIYAGHITNHLKDFLRFMIFNEEGIISRETRRNLLPCAFP